MSRLIPLFKTTPQTSQTRRSPEVSLAVKSLASILRHHALRNMESIAVTARGNKGMEGEAFRV
jgi:hypothetical protein